MQREDSNKCHRNLQIPRIHRVLSLFHQRLLENSSTIATINTSNKPLVLETRRTNNIRNTTESNDRQTSTLTTIFHQTILSTYRCISIWHGSHTLTGGRIHQPKCHLKTQTTPSCLLLRHLH